MSEIYTWGGRREGAGRKKAPTDPQAIKARMTLEAARAKRLIYEANLAELEYQQRRAGLISQASISLLLDNAEAALHHHFDSLPGDLSQRIADSTDVREIDLLLTGEIRRRLEAVADTKLQKVTEP